MRVILLSNLALRAAGDIDGDRQRVYLIANASDPLLAVDEQTGLAIPQIGQPLRHGSDRVAHRLTVSGQAAYPERGQVVVVDYATPEELVIQSAVKSISIEKKK